MFRRIIKGRKWRKAGIILSMVILFWIFWNATSSKEASKKILCARGLDFHENLHKLAYRVHEILEKHKLTHYLCYGSLWGQVRAGKALPWQADVEMCLKNEEINHDESFVLRMFRKDNLNIAYNSADGLYTVTDPELKEMKVELIVFENDDIIEVSRRIGWKRRILPPDCTMNPSLHCFPPQLAEGPLPLEKFGNYLFPVPKDGFEIQKYLYADNWWKEVIPKDCEFHNTIDRKN